MPQQIEQWPKAVAWGRLRHVPLRVEKGASLHEKNERTSTKRERTNSKKANKTVFLLRFTR